MTDCSGVGFPNSHQEFIKFIELYSCSKLAIHDPILSISGPGCPAAALAVLQLPWLPWLFNNLLNHINEVAVERAELENMIHKM